MQKKRKNMYTKCESFCRMCDSQIDSICMDFARKKKRFLNQREFHKDFFMSLLFVVAKDERKKIESMKIAHQTGKSKIKMDIKCKTWCCLHGAKEFIENYIFFCIELIVNAISIFDIQFNVKIHL